jgi:hypothetical protein
MGQPPPKALTGTLETREVLLRAKPQGYLTIRATIPPEEKDHVTEDELTQIN